MNIKQGGLMDLREIFRNDLAVLESPDGVLRELALFAGAGGGILAGRLLGWRTVCAVERDAHCAAVLAQRQNDGLLRPFPVWSDVETFDGGPWAGRVDVVFGIEDLNVKGMAKNRHLARSVSDMGFFEFRRQLEYKAAMRGGLVVVADRWFASSKTCSCCGRKVESLPLATRQWACPACGANHDRDLNAARNLAGYAVSSTVSACGGEGSGPGRKPRAKPAPAKQEANAKATYG